ncbi:MAG TPA: 50S ribosomal protein L25/general stress protein Ctc [Gammaproteobacteria bacterium]|nr:50S ribosomal protein L25/general stress protein Ctc [Gammaproteobacteria bacterium]
MKVSFELNAEVRNDLGKGASRRLRRSGKLPAILYGAGKDPLPLQMDHDAVMHKLEHEAFYSHILTVKVGGEEVKAVLKDLQRHPYKPAVLHMDLQRIDEEEKLRMHVPLHFVGEDVAPGVKQSGGVISHLVTEVEVTCLPRHLPEYIEVDVSGLGVNESLHLSDLALPEGVELVELMHGPEHDLPVVSIHLPRGATEAEAEEEAGEAGEGEGEEA